MRKFYQDYITFNTTEINSDYFNYRFNDIDYRIDDLETTKESVDKYFHKGIISPLPSSFNYTINSNSLIISPGTILLNQKKIDIFQTVIDFINLPSNIYYLEINTDGIIEITTEQSLQRLPLYKINYDGIQFNSIEDLRYYAPTLKELKDSRGNYKTLKERLDTIDGTFNYQEQNFLNHINNTSNPHQTSLQQAVNINNVITPVNNRYIKFGNDLEILNDGSIKFYGQQKINDIPLNDLLNHRLDTNNPHKTTLQQAALENPNISTRITINNTIFETDGTIYYTGPSRTIDGVDLKQLKTKVDSIKPFILLERIVRETPSGFINGVNKIFTLSNTEIVSNTEEIFINGILQNKNTSLYSNDNDYIMINNQIIFTIPPPVGSIIFVNYSIPQPTNNTFIWKYKPLGQVDGINKIFALPVKPIKEEVYLNGLLQTPGPGPGVNDYYVENNLIIFNEAPWVGAVILVNYQVEVI